MHKALAIWQKTINFYKLLSYGPHIKARKHLKVLGFHYRLSSNFAQFSENIHLDLRLNGKVIIVIALLLIHYVEEKKSPVMFLSRESI